MEFYRDTYGENTIMILCTRNIFCLPILDKYTVLMRKNLLIYHLEYFETGNCDFSPYIKSLDFKEVYASQL